MPTKTLKRHATKTRRLQSREITLRSATLSIETRTVEAVVSTDTPATVYDLRRFEMIDEILLPDGAQLPKQAPLLDAHDRSSTAAMLGSVRNLAKRPEGVVGTLHFAEGTPDADRAWNLTRQGHLTDVSAGYVVVEFTDIPAGRSATVKGRSYTAGQRTLRIATRWRLREVSLIPIGADENAKIRGADAIRSLPKARRRRLREYLEQMGVRSDATSDELWECITDLDDGRRGEALAIARGQIATVPDASLSGQREQRDEHHDEREIPVDPFWANGPPAPSDYWRDDEGQREEGDDGAAAATPTITLTTEQADAIREQAAADERQRFIEIERIAREYNAPDNLTARAINEGWSVEQTRDEFNRDWR